IVRLAQGDVKDAGVRGGDGNGAGEQDFGDVHGDAVDVVDERLPGGAVVFGAPQAAARRGHVEHVAVVRIDHHAGDAAGDRIVADGLAAVDGPGTFGKPAQGQIGRGVGTVAQDRQVFAADGDVALEFKLSIVGDDGAAERRPQGGGALQIEAAL